MHKKNLILVTLMLKKNCKKLLSPVCQIFTLEMSHQRSCACLKTSIIFSPVPWVPVSSLCLQLHPCRHRSQLCPTLLQPQGLPWRQHRSPHQPLNGDSYTFFNDLKPTFETLPFLLFCSTLSLLLKVFIQKCHCLVIF